MGGWVGGGVKRRVGAKSGVVKEVRLDAVG